MNIGIDIDGTLINSFDYFQPYVAEYFSVGVDYLKENNISYSNFPDNWNEVIKIITNNKEGVI